MDFTDAAAQDAGVFRRHSLTWPVVVFVLVLVLTVTLTVLWNVVLVHDYLRIQQLAETEAERSGPFHTTFIALGSSLFLVIIALVSIFGARMFAEIRWGRRQENFLASVSHELNSPLQSIKLQAQTLARQELPPDHRQRFLQALLEDVDRLTALIQNVLRAAQIDQRQLAVRLEKVALRDFLQTYVDRAASLFERGEDGRQITLCPGDDCCVEVDRLLLRQLLDNLVDNAVKYSPVGQCRIELSLEAALGRPAVLVVRDQGIGLPRDQRRRIFERFYRIQDEDPDRSRHGTGLGLSIVRSIAKTHGWEVRAVSDGPGQGTAVLVEIPVYESMRDDVTGGAA